MKVFVAGIDVGTQSTKVVLLHEVYFSSFICDNRAQPAGDAAQKALELALGKTNLPNDIKYVVATGQGSQFVTFASDQEADFVCLAKGIDFLLPSARIVIDMGAKKCLVIKCRESKVENTAVNDRCAAGAGLYLEIIADILGVSLDQTGALSLKSKERLEIVSTCGVFIESEVISLTHSRKKVEDILMGVFRGLAERTVPLVTQLGLEGDIALTGGLAKNRGIVRAMKEAIGYEILVPQNPQIVPALGAAIIAQEKST